MQLKMFITASPSGDLGLPCCCTMHDYEVLIRLITIFKNFLLIKPCL